MAAIKRPAKRIIPEERFQKGVKYLDKNKGTVIPENKKPLVQKTINELQRKYAILEKKAKNLETKVKKLDLDKEDVSEVIDRRRADILLVKKGIKRHMFESVKDRLEEGFSPAEILAAGYNPQELALGYFRYEQANKANVKKPNYKKL
jgi:hypothetical protein